MATLDPNSTLSLLQLNAWSGSTYELNWSVRNFTSYETPDQTEARYQSTLSQITALAPDVITLQECMPTFKYAQRLAQDLGYDCYARTGVAGIILGPLHIPSNKITEGDAILAKREWNLKVIGRKALTGMVFGEYFSLNTDNATQTIGVEVTKGGRKFHIYCTHWTASVLDDAVTRATLGELRETPIDVGIGETPKSFTEAEIDEGEQAVAKGTDTRVQEATLTHAFIDLKTVADATVILAGDLNTVADTPELKYLLSRNYTPVALPPNSLTWDVANPNCIAQDRPENEGSRGPVEDLLYANLSKMNCTLDHVFVKDNALPNYMAEICMKESINGAVPSDHYGIFVTFQI